MQIEQRVKRYDTEDFLYWLRNFPGQVESAVELGRQAQIERPPVNRIYLGGMGGSGITGDLLSQFLYDKLTVPIRTIRDYQLPAEVDSRALVILVSYSGNTEETLSLYEAAQQVGASCLAITSGGELAARIKADPSGQLLTIPGGQPPRASAPYLFLPLVFWLDRVELATAPSSDAVVETVDELSQLVEELDPSVEENPALSLAGRLYDGINIIYGSQPLTAPLALRLKNQFNENAKMMAFANQLPELNHNEIMGWRQLATSQEKYRAIFLRDRSEHPRIQKRFDITAELLGELVEGIDQLTGRGESRFARFMSLMLYTDYVSYYAALLRGEDPSEITAIERLKERL